MIADFNNFDHGSSIRADVCIVGAGAAGIAIAREFVGSHLKILVLESGGFDSDPECQKLFESDVVGLPHASIYDGRARVFGGTTTLWGGQALRFDPFDFEEKSWVPYSGWPISRESIDPYYERAERVLHLGPQIPFYDLCSSFGIEAPAFDPEKLCLECSRWSPKPNFGTAYRYEVNGASNVVVLLHANATEIVTNPSASAVDHVEFKTLAGKQGIAISRCYVICCGGIETARLLLASTSVMACGVGNAYDQVGRYFQEHVHINFGQVQTKNRARLQDIFESFFVKGLKHAPLVTLTPQMQVRRQLLGVHGVVVFESPADSGIVATKKLFRAMIGRSLPERSEIGRLVARSLMSPGELLGLAYRLQVQNRAGTPRQGPILFGAQCEMAPNPNSRVMLSESKDRLGMPRVKLDWQLGDLERRTLYEYVGVLAAEFERLGLGVFDRKQIEFLTDPARWVARAHDSAHHMGTARMHDSPRYGVVNSDCQVHGMANLFIGSSAVFPTSARSNPTLTMLALCLRLADRLKQLRE